MREKNLSLIKEKISNEGYLWVFRKVFKYGGLFASKWTGKTFSGPLLASLQVTYRCNCRCIMCNLWNRAGDIEFVQKEFISIIDRLASLGINAISFTGGEPLLRKDIFSLIEYAKRKGLVTQMPTNGAFLDKDTARRVLNCGLDALTISIDSSNASVHDEIRGAKIFEKLIEGIKNIVTLKKELNSKTIVSLSCVIDIHNIAEILKLVDFASDMGVDNISFFSEEGTMKNDVILRPENRERILKILDQLIEMKKKKNNIIDNSIASIMLLKERYNGKKMPIKCMAGFTTIFIDCYGNVFPCNFLLSINKPIGNIKNDGIKELWYSKEYNELRKKMLNCKNCYYVCHLELNAIFSRYAFLK